MATIHQIHIYRNDLGDSTNHGVTNTQNAHNKYFYLLTGPMSQEQIDQHFSKPDPRNIFLILKSHQNGYLYCTPIGTKKWTMFGGNFAWSCDSNFRNNVSEQPIPVHDRIE